MTWSTDNPKPKWRGTPNDPLAEEKRRGGAPQNVDGAKPDEIEQGQTGGPQGYGTSPGTSNGKNQRRAPVELILICATILFIVFLWIAFSVPLNPGDIFEDDFSDKDFSDDIGGWDLSKYNKGDAVYADGGLRMYDTPSSLIYSSFIYEVGDIEDAIVKVDAKWTGGALGWKEFSKWGVRCHSTDNGYGGYSLGIYGDGDARIVKYDEKNGNPTVLAEGYSRDAIREGSQTNHIRADCVGNKLTLYVNGKEVLKAKDGEFESGVVGLFVEYTADKGPGVEVLFDNFQVSTP